MKRSIPQNKETPFSFDEIFFSVTDQKGIILFGNETFIRISGFAKDVILNSPHNIIRHPDMPKSVFKVFWDALKGEQPIAAYVKNLSADGAYYWVFAFAFPIQDGYLSIRFKPSSPVFEKVKSLYAAVLQHEKSHTLEESVAYLQELLGQEGFSSYVDFMTKAAFQELRHRDEYLKEHRSEKVAETSYIINSIASVTTQTSHELNKNFSKISDFQHAGRVFQETIEKLDLEYGKLRMVSINMNVLAAKFGEKAASLEVVAQEFSKLSEEIANHIRGFSGFILELNSSILNCSQCILGLRTQIIMVEFFVNESIKKLATEKDAFSEMVANKDHFCWLFNQTRQALEREILKLNERIRQTVAKIDEIQKFTIGLEVIKLTGAIESSRDNEIMHSFVVYLQEMNLFIKLLKSAITDIDKQNKILIHGTHEIHSSNVSLKENIMVIFEKAMKAS